MDQECLKSIALHKRAQKTPATKGWEKEHSHALLVVMYIGQIFESRFGISLCFASRRLSYRKTNTSYKGICNHDKHLRCALPI